MKFKRIAILIALIALLGVLAACENLREQANPAAVAASDKPRVIVTIFPQYDFLRAIGGDKIELSMLLAPGAESHSFEPTPKDMIAIAEADLFVYVGGHADAWVDDLLETRGDDKVSLALVDMVDTVEEEIIEGMEHEHDHEHDHEHEHEHEHKHDHTLDEHVWTDPQNAIRIVHRLTAALVELDPDNADFYEANAADYITELEALDTKFAALIESAPDKTIVVGDRFPLRYFVDRYGLDYYAAFPGCSTEGDASPQTIAYLVDKVEDENLPVVFHIELSNQQIANSIAEITGAEVLEFHGLHNISPEDFTAGRTYIDIMEQNYENLSRALAR